MHCSVHTHYTLSRWNIPVRNCSPQTPAGRPASPSRPWAPCPRECCSERSLYVVSGRTAVQTQWGDIHTIITRTNVLFWRLLCVHMGIHYIQTPQRRTRTKIDRRDYLTEVMRDSRTSTTRPHTTNTLQLTSGILPSAVGSSSHGGGGPTAGRRAGQGAVPVRTVSVSNKVSEDGCKINAKKAIHLPAPPIANVKNNLHHNTTRHNTTQHITTHHNTSQRITTIYCTKLHILSQVTSHHHKVHYTKPHNTTQKSLHFKTQHNTTLHHTTPLNTTKHH